MAIPGPLRSREFWIWRPDMGKKRCRKVLRGMLCLFRFRSGGQNDESTSIFSPRVLLCQEEEDDAAIISCGIFRRCGLGLCRPGNGYSQSGRATRGKPSGPPFNAHFIEVAAQAGQRTPTVYGEVDLKQHLIKTIGCGCAFFDYDNDGWLDIFLLSDTRIGHDSEGNQSFV